VFPALSLAVAVGAILACPRGFSVRSKTVGVSVPYELASLDPHRRDWLGAFALLSNVYEPLVTTDASMAVKPCLAARWDNPDPKTWVFHLEPRARFHSGRPLEAEDVVATFARLRETPGLDMARYADNVAEVRALDPKTVVLRTRRPTALLLGDLRFLVVVPRGATEEKLARSADGTGPYRLAAPPEKGIVRFVRSRTYWGPPPPLEDVTFRLARSAKEANDDLLSGRSDLVQIGSRALGDALMGRADVMTQRQSSVFVKYLGCDATRPATPFCDLKPNPFTKKDVRRAVSLALDRRALVEKLSTYAAPADQLVPPFIFGYHQSLPPPRYDPAEARRLLAAAGYPEGFDVTLHVRQILAETAEAIRGMLLGVGIRARIASLSDGEFFDTAEKTGLTFFVTRRGCTTGDASMFFEFALHSFVEAKGLGGSNLARFSDPDLDRKIEHATEIFDMAERRRLLEEIEAQGMDDLAWIPLYVDQDFFAFKRSLTYTPRLDSYVLASDIAPAK